jgi:3-isopropylmalate/(R)-2-methylmalate dehydratase small subunit
LRRATQTSFFNNSFKNGLLPIVLPEVMVTQLIDDVAAFQASPTIDLARSSSRGEIPFKSKSFASGWVLTTTSILAASHKIKAFEVEFAALCCTTTHLAHMRSNLDL